MHKWRAEVVIPASTGSFKRATKNTRDNKATRHSRSARPKIRRRGEFSRVARLTEKPPGSRPRRYLACRASLSFIRQPDIERLSTHNDFPSIATKRGSSSRERLVHAIYPASVPLANAEIVRETSGDDDDNDDASEIRRAALNRRRNYFPAKLKDFMEAAREDRALSNHTRVRRPPRRRSFAIRGGDGNDDAYTLHVVVVVESLALPRDSLRRSPRRQSRRF